MNGHPLRHTWSAVKVPLIVLGLILIALLVSVAEFSGEAPESSFLNWPVFVAVDRVDELIAVALAVLVGSQWSAKLGLLIIGVTLVAHVPFVALEPAQRLSEVAGLVLVAAMGIAGVTYAQKRKRAEAVFSSVASNSPTGIYIVQNGRFVYANQAIQQSMRLTRQELLGRDPMDFVLPEDQGHVRSSARAMLKKGSSAAYQFRAAAKDGRTLWLVEKVTSVDYLGKRATLGNIVDVTELRDASEALRTSEKKYRDLVDRLPCGIGQAKLDGSLLMLNPAGARILGFEVPGDAVDKATLDDVFCDLSSRQKLTDEITKTGFWSDEIRARKRDGTVVWLQANAVALRNEAGDIDGLEGVFTDVTEKKKAECALADHARRMEAHYRVSQGLCSSLDLVSLGELLLREALGITDMECGMLVRLDETKQELVPLASVGLPLQVEHNIRPIRCGLETGHDPVSDALRSGTPLVIDDMRIDAPDDAFDMACHGYRCSALVPARAKGRVVGLITCFSKRQMTFDVPQMEALASLGTMVGMALANAQLFEQVQRASGEWRKTFDSMGESVAILDREHRFVRANTSFGRLVGLTPKELVGKKCCDLLHGFERAPEDCPGFACLTTGNGNTVEWQEPHLGGRWLRMSCRPLVNQEGECVSVIHVISDIGMEKAGEQQLKDLHAMSATLSESLDLDTVLTVASESVARSFGGPEATVAILLLDEWEQGANLVAVTGKNQPQLKRLRIPATNVPADAMNSLMNERAALTGDNCRKLFSKVSGLENFVCCTAVPLVAADRTIGALFVEGNGDLSSEEVTRLEAWSRQVALAVGNAEMHRRTDAALQRRLSELQALMGIVKSASSSLDLQVILKEVMGRSAAALAVDRVGIMLLDDSGARLTLHSWYDLAAGCLRKVGRELQLDGLPTLAGIIRDGRPRVLDDPPFSLEKEGRPFAQPGASGLALSVPMLSGGKAVGLLCFVSASRSVGYSADDSALAVAIAGHLASVVCNVRTYERAERERVTLESTMGSMSEGLIVSDQLGRVLYCNPAAGRFLSLDATEIIGLERIDCDRIVASRFMQADAIEKALRESTRTDSVLKAAARTVQGLDIEWTSFPVKSNGTRLGRGALLRDVTREREVDRMKSEFISIASHELRTPMTSVYGFAELLLTRSTSLSDSERSWVGIIHKESKRLTDIVEDLLNVSRIESGVLKPDMKPIAITPVVKAVFEELASLYPRHEFICSVSETAPSVMADEDKLAQVVTNLVDNAAKYSPAGGEVTVGASADAAEGWLTLRVSDQGIGIPHEEIPKLFGRFHRIRHEGTQNIRGNGLGLYIAKSLVDLMEGQIEVESEPGKGSTFIVRLRQAGS